jgi:hypothetical protein
LNFLLCDLHIDVHPQIAGLSSIPCGIDMLQIDFLLYDLHIDVQPQIADLSSIPCAIDMLQIDMKKECFDPIQAPIDHS